MSNDLPRNLRQILLIELVLGDKSFEALGPYDHDGFRHIEIDRKDFGSDWVRFDISEYSCNSSAWPDHYTIDSQLRMTTWLDVCCRWDADELDKPQQGCFRSLTFEINEDVDFDGISLDDPNLSTGILEKIAEYRYMYPYDWWRDEFKEEQHAVSEFVEKQPETN